MAPDWRSWHDDYDRPGSRLADRLAVVQQCIRTALDAMPAGPIQAISVCAGEGRDLLAVVADHPRGPDVRGRLVELDPTLAARAAARAPAGIEVTCGDAATTDAYRGAVPADLVLLCGIFGNVSDRDIERTVRALPTLCAAGATAIWTRHCRPPDRTVDIRRWLAETGFEEVSFTGSRRHYYGVGAHRFTGASQAWRPGVRLFDFVAYDARRA